MFFATKPGRVGPRILSLESVEYFGTSENYWVVEKKKKNLTVFIRIGAHPNPSPLPLKLK